MTHTVIQMLTNTHKQQNKTRMRKIIAFSPFTFKLLSKIVRLYSIEDENLSVDPSQVKYKIYYKLVYIIIKIATYTTCTKAYFTQQNVESLLLSLVISNLTQYYTAFSSTTVPQQLFQNEQQTIITS